jgi:PST family polysaccharide transporter
VGRFLGPESVGYVSLIIRLVEVLTFVKNVSWRLAIVALSKIQRDAVKLQQALEEAMSLQILAVGPLLAGFALVASSVVPRVFGSRWEPSLVIYPFVALGYLINAMFNLQSSVLYVRQRNRDVTYFHVLHMLLFTGSALVLIPRFGLVGYGLAEVVAIASYPAIHRRTARIVGITYRGTVPWLVALVPPLFAAVLPIPLAPLLWMPAIGVLVLLPREREKLVGYLGYVRRLRTFRTSMSMEQGRHDSG